MTSTIDALDELNRARSVLELVKMACREGGDEHDAFAMGVEMAAGFIDRAEAALNKIEMDK